MRLEMGVIFVLTEATWTLTIISNGWPEYNYTLIVTMESTSTLMSFLRIQ